jgi:hypothetical protein
MDTIRERRPEARTWLAVCAFLAIAAFFLWTEHRAHILGVLPYVLLAACPIIHLFMHRSHGHHRPTHGGHDQHTAQRQGGMS